MVVYTPEAGPDWIGHVLTILTFIGGIWLVVYQLAKQHRSSLTLLGEQHASSLTLQRDSAREQLKLEVYESFYQAVHRYVEADSQAQSYVRQIEIAFALERSAARLGMPSTPMRQRAEQMRELHSAVREAGGSVVRELEKWEIAFTHAKLFRISLVVAGEDLDEAFGPFLSKLIPLLPMDDPDGSLMRSPPPPDESAFEDLRRSISAYLASALDLRNYAHDLVVEAQNSLLNGMFGREVPARQPIDPAVKVIKGKDAEVLLKYFLNETASGRRIRDAEEEVRSYLRARGVEPAA